MSGECDKCHEHTLDCTCWPNDLERLYELSKPERKMIDLEFIERAKKLMKPLWDEFIEIRRQRIDKWNKENHETLRKCQKEYDSSKKGIIANKRKNCTRNRRYRESCKNLTHEDLENIKNFYVNCPKGYEVDHIMPISRGGKHILSNLQYLTPTENRRKGNRI